MGSSTGHPGDQNVFLDKQVCELFSHLGSVFCEIMWSKKHRDKNKIFEAVKLAAMRHCCIAWCSGNNIKSLSSTVDPAVMSN